MPSGYMIITEKDWDKASPEQRDWMIFRTIQDINKRLEKLERRSFIHKAMAFAGGIVGGVLAFMGLK